MVSLSQNGERWLLDSCVCVDLLRGRRESRALPVGACSVSAIAACELWTGAEKMGAFERGELELLFTVIPVLEFSTEAVPHYGAIRVHLERKGMTIGALDLLIAAHALSLGATLVTANVAEFKRVPKLRVLAW